MFKHTFIWFFFFFFLDKTPKKEIPGHSQPHHPEFKRENTDKLIGGKLT